MRLCLKQKGTSSSRIAAKLQVVLEVSVWGVLSFLQALQGYICHFLSPAQGPFLSSFSLAAALKQVLKPFSGLVRTLVFCRSLVLFLPALRRPGGRLSDSFCACFLPLRQDMALAEKGSLLRGLSACPGQKIRGVAAVRLTAARTSQRDLSLCPGTLRHCPVCLQAACGILAPFPVPGQPPESAPGPVCSGLARSGAVPDPAQFLIGNAPGLHA